MVVPTSLGLLIVLLSTMPIAVDNNNVVLNSSIIESKNTWHFALSQDGGEIAYRLVDEPSRLVIYDVHNRTYKSLSAPQGYFVFLEGDRLVISNFTDVQTVIKLFDLATGEERTLITDERLPRFLDGIKNSQSFIVGFLNNTTQKMDFVVVNSTTKDRVVLNLPEAHGRMASTDALYYSNESDNFTLWRFNLATRDKSKVGDFKVSSLSSAYQTNPRELAFIPVTDLNSIWIYPDRRQISISGLLSDAEISPDGAYVAALVTFPAKPGEFPTPTQLVLLSKSKSGAEPRPGSMQPLPSKQTPGFEAAFALAVLVGAGLFYQRRY